MDLASRTFVLHVCELVIGFWPAHGRLGVSVEGAGCVIIIKFAVFKKMCDVVGFVLYAVGGAMVRL